MLWGQGLRTDDKMAELFRASLGVPADIDRWAHSGAQVWAQRPADSGLLGILTPHPGLLLPATSPTSALIASTPQPSVDVAKRNGVGEEPLATPYTYAQLAVEAKHQPKADIVILNVGINDVGVWNIVLPFKDAAALQARIRSLSGYPTALLNFVHGLHPEAKILVAGYYPIVTERSDTSRLLRFSLTLASHHEQLFQLHGFTGYQHAVEAAKQGLVTVERDVSLLGPRNSPSDHLVRLSKLWTDEIHRLLQREIDAFNAPVGRIAALAKPEFGPDNGVFAPRPLLWGLGPNLEPEDPVAKDRLGPAASMNLVDRFICERASMGHPNEAGSRAFAVALRAAWDGLQAQPGKQAAPGAA